MNRLRTVGIPALALSLSLLGGCAATSSSPTEIAGPQRIQGPVEDREMWEAVTALEMHKAQLAQLQGIEACADVCRLSALICTAGARICEISGRHEGEQAYAGRCAGAQGDCKSARLQCSDCK